MSDDTYLTSMVLFSHNSQKKCDVKFDPKYVMMMLGKLNEGYRSWSQLLYPRRSSHPIGLYSSILTKPPVDVVKGPIIQTPTYEWPRRWNRDVTVRQDMNLFAEELAAGALAEKFFWRLPKPASRNQIWLPSRLVFLRNWSIGIARKIQGHTF